MRPIDPNLKAFELPDISRDTPYFVDQCYARLEEFVEKRQGRFKESIEFSNDHEHSVSHSFRLESELFPRLGAMRGYSPGKVIVLGILTPEESGKRRTKVHIIIKTHPDNYVILALLIAFMFGLFGLVARNLPILENIVAGAFTTGMVGYVLWRSYVDTNRFKRELLDDLRVIFHKEDEAYE